MTMPSIANPAVTQEAIDDARKALPDRLFRQYYLAEFVDDGNVFVGFRDCIVGEPVSFFSFVNLWLADMANTADVVIGVDWAKKHDFTVFYAIDVTGTKQRTVGYCRFQGMPYTEAVKQLMSFAKHFKRVIQVRHDRTGVGEAIDDLLGGSGLPVEGLTFTNQNKNKMVGDLMLCFEQRGLTLPNIPELLYELDMFEVVTSGSGAMRFNAPSGMHDDIVSAMMLAHAAAVENSADFTVSFLDELPSRRLTLDRFYDDLMSDGDEL